MSSKKRVLVFAAGTKDGGGSGARKLIEFRRSGMLDVDIALVSNHLDGGVRKLAEEFQLPFTYLTVFDEAAYRGIVDSYRPDVIMLSGWLKLFTYFPPDVPILNIHPGLASVFGGPGMYGHHVHEAHIAGFHASTQTYSAVCIQFINKEYDRGPVFFELRIPIFPGDTPNTLADRVNEQEHGWQWWALWLVVTRQIFQRPDGTVVIPDWYATMPFCPENLR